MRRLSTSADTPQQQTHVPLRKQLKDEAKARKRGATSSDAINDPHTPSTNTIDPNLLASYELTVGLEIHAELSTAHKLFSQASTSLTATPNTHVSPFDAALPGSQPTFQRATLLPALRAALALGCTINHTSTWDRKHYFHWDQPSGYQITQYYRPFAINGSLHLNPADRHTLTAPLEIGIKQIQLEQDTAKTILQPPSTHLLDFNRVSHPLIEIISLPHLHTPEAAAAFVKKVQSILRAVNACDTGMEMGGIRADVNVSVKPRNLHHAAAQLAHLTANGGDANGNGLSYGGVDKLGQRTEIKNLSSIAAVSAAIAAERDRQIVLLEAGGRVEGETRGWTLGASSTHRLRGKEGEVDYRYMADADLAPLVIGRDLIEFLRDTLPELPEETVARLVDGYGVSEKDAWTLVEADEGERAEFYFETLEILRARLRERDGHAANSGPQSEGEKKAEIANLGRQTANWVLHELGSLLSTSSRAFSPDIITAEQLAAILALLQTEQITLPTAKALLARAFESSLPSDVDAFVDAQGLRLKAMSDDDYSILARELVQGNAKMAGQARREAVVARADQEDAESGPNEVGSAGKRKKVKTGGKLMWFVGQMVRRGEAGRIQPERAERAVREVLLGSTEAG